MDDARAALQSVLEQTDWPQEVAGDLASKAHIITYEKGAVIFHAGESCDLVYVLVAGEVRLYYTSTGGDRLLVAIARSGTMLGIMDIAPAASDLDSTAQAFTAESLSRSKVAVIAREQVAGAARRLPALQLARMMHRASEQWVAFSGRLLAFLTMDVRSRLAYAILEIADRFGVPDARGRLITLKLSHEDFGELVGASRPMVSKHLKDLEKAGVFFKQDGRYVLSRAHELGSLDAAGGLSIGTEALTARTAGRTGYRHGAGVR